MRLKQIKVKKIIIYCITLLIIALSCKKEIDQFPRSANLKTSQIPYSDIKLEDSLLSFANMATFVSSLTVLERETHKWDSAFVAQNSLLSGDALSDYEDSTNFDCEKPLTDFESNYSFNSLRQKINDYEEIWLNNETLIDSTDPDDYFINDNVLRTVLNEYNEVIIDGSIYKPMEDGTTIEITDCSMLTLSKIRQNLINIDTASNIIVHFSDVNRSNTCRMISKSGYVYNGSNYRLKWVCSVISYPWAGYAKAKTKSYKKKRRRWKKYRTYMEASISGKVTSGNCTQQTIPTVFVNGNKKQITAKVTSWGNTLKTEKGITNSYHKAVDRTHNYTLTW